MKSKANLHFKKGDGLDMAFVIQYTCDVAYSQLLGPCKYSFTYSFENGEQSEVNFESSVFNLTRFLI